MKTYFEIPTHIKQKYITSNTLEHHMYLHNDQKTQGAKMPQNYFKTENKIHIVKQILK